MNICGKCDHNTNMLVLRRAGLLKNHRIIEYLELEVTEELKNLGRSLWGELL